MLTSTRQLACLGVFLTVLSSGVAKANPIINGDFSTGDFTGWTVSAIDQSGNPTAPLFNVVDFGGGKAVDLTTGNFAQDRFIQTLEQSYTVDADNTVLSFDITAPEFVPDPTGSGTSLFGDALVVAIGHGSDFFEVLLMDETGTFADPFGTALSEVTLGAADNHFFDFNVRTDLASLAGEAVTLFVDVINEDDGKQFGTPHFSNAKQTTKRPGTAPEAPTLWLFLMGVLGLYCQILRRSSVPVHAPNNPAGVSNRGLAIAPNALFAVVLWNMAQPAWAADIDRSELGDVSAQTTLHLSGIFHDRRRRTSTTNVQVENTSASPIDTPLIVVVESISDPNVTLINGDGSVTPDGVPFVDLSGQVPGERLDPAETTNRRPLRFSNPSMRPFNLTVVAYRHVTTPPSSTITLHIPTDAKGRTLIGAGDNVELTVNADGTAPVTVTLGQRPAGDGARGRVGFGPGRNETLAVTTSGGASNSVRVRLWGDAQQVSAWQGDTLVTAAVGGTETTAEPVTVYRIALDRPFTTLLNDMVLQRTLVTQPLLPDVPIDWTFYRLGTDQDHYESIARTVNGLNIWPVDGGPMKTGANGLLEVYFQMGLGQGRFWGFAAANPDEPKDGTTTDPNGEKPCSANKGDQGDERNKGPRSVGLCSGEKQYSATYLNIKGRGLDYRFTGTYRSQNSNYRVVSPDDFGVDWVFSYSDRLIQEGQNIVIMRDTLRSDAFIATASGEFIAPQEYYESLRFVAGNIEIRNRDGTIRTFAGFDDPDIPGRLTRLEDRNGNFMSFLYEVPAGLSKFVLVTVVDSMGRNIVYRYYDNGEPNPGRRGRLKEIEDFRRDNASEGRKVVFDYDAEGNLVSVRSPIVQGTPGGNDFPDGKTTVYTYTLDADIPPWVTGADRERLRHNLLSIQYPNETASGGGNPREVVTYGTDPGDPNSFDRVLTYTIGGTNASGVAAGGTIDYTYQIVEYDSRAPNDPFIETSVMDRNRNLTKYLHSADGTMLVRREFTNGLRNGEPDAFLTEHAYNPDRERTRTRLPEGNIIETLYDRTNPDRFQQGNVIRTTRFPGARGGDQNALVTEIVYEPIYQQVAAVTDPRGTDGSFAPPLGDNCKRNQRERYTTRYFFDFQEASAALVLPLLADELHVSEAEVATRLGAAGIELDLGDLNGDGDTSPRIAGNVVREEAPSATLLAGSNQAAFNGTCQEIVTLYRYNRFGQMTSMVDPEANVQTYEYYPEIDADGDGIDSPDPTDGRSLDDTTGGYLEQEVRDARHLAGANNGNAAPPTSIQMDYTYDDVGNKTSVIDGRGIQTDYVVNELNQIVRNTRAAALPGIGTAEPPEPLPLTAFAYIEDTFYDFNDNVVARRVEDRGDTSNTGGFVDYTIAYDILDNLLEKTEEVGNGKTLITTYRYDANENRILEIQPEQNRQEMVYDERDLLFQKTRGASGPRGGVPATTTYNYDRNQNLIEEVDAEDTDGSAANNSTIAGLGDSAMYLYDGFDRRATVIDAVGNKTSVNFDPVGNVVREARFGLPGGPSPTSKGGAGNVRLTETEYLYDELNRKFQEDRLLFVSNGVATVRPADITDGALTPNDGKVTMRYEYDRESRRTFMIEDDLDTYRTDYDGADRTILSLDPAGNRVQHAYDDNDNLIETRETDVAQIGGVADEVFLTTYFYDSLDRISQTTDNLGHTDYRRYDSRDNEVCMADAQGPSGGGISRRAFAPGPRTVNDINGFGNVTLYAYDGINRRVGEDRVLTASGQGDGVNIGCTLEGIKAAPPAPDPGQGGGDGLITVLTEWDDNSLLASLTDDNGNQTRYAFDNLNRKTTETKGICVPPGLADRCDPPTTIEWFYDPDDNVLRLVDENGSVIDNGYDAINRRTAVDIRRAGNEVSPKDPSATFPPVIGTTEVGYEYDGLSRLTLAGDNNEPGDTEDDSLIGFAYDSLSRVIEETQQIGGLTARAISSAWEAENLRVGVTYPNDRRLDFTYDGLDRLKTVADEGAAERIAEYDYIGTGRVLERRYPINGTRMTRLNDAGNADIGYDGVRRTVQLRNLRSDNSDVVGFTHDYDRMDNRLNQEKLHDTNSSELYSYDSEYRLFDFERGVLSGGGDSIVSPDPDNLQQQQWSLDGTGNWAQTVLTESGVDTVEDREHSSFNELIHRQDGAPEDLAYDDNGNLIADAEYLYEWDYRNRLRRVSRKAIGLLGTYTYDARNRRVLKSVANSAPLNGATRFYYDDWRVLEERDGAELLTQQYVYGVYIDEVLVMDQDLDGDGSATGPADNRLFYHQDALYSVYALTEVDGAVLESYLYDAYGCATIFDGAGNPVPVNPWTSPHSAVGNPYMFTGRRLDEETGLYFFRARHYDCEKGRFLQRDPIGYFAGMNLFAYVRNNPGRWVDPWGLNDGSSNAAFEAARQEALNFLREQREGGLITPGEYNVLRQTFEPDISGIRPDVSNENMPSGPQGDTRLYWEAVPEPTFFQNWVWNYPQTISDIRTFIYIQDSRIDLFARYTAATLLAHVGGKLVSGVGRWVSNTRIAQIIRSRLPNFSNVGRIIRTPLDEWTRGGAYNYWLREHILIDPSQFSGRFGLYLRTFHDDFHRRLYMARPGLYFRMNFWLHEKFAQGTGVIRASIRYYNRTVSSRMRSATRNILLGIGIGSHHCP